MAAPYNPPKKNEEFIFRLALEDMANPGSFKSNPTIAAADFNVWTDATDNGALDTTPTVSPASSIWVLITLSAAEMKERKLPKNMANYFYYNSIKPLFIFFLLFLRHK